MKSLGSTFYDRHSPFILTGRANAEVELLALNLAPTTVLNLAGLWGGQRVVRNWLGRVAPTKAALKSKVWTDPYLCGTYRPPPRAAST